MNIIHNILKAHESERTQEIYERCIAHFNIFHVLNYMMYEEYLKTYDLIEEQHLNRFMVKKGLKKCNAIFDRYTTFMTDHLPKDKWYLNQDYARIAYEEMEPKFTFLYVAACNLLNKKKAVYPQIMSHSICVLFLLEIIEGTWELFFKSYYEASGVNYSKEFEYASMGEFYREYVKVHNELFKASKESIYLMDDPACKNAIMALKNHINNQGSFDDAALRAINLNPKACEDYKEAVAEFEREEEEKNNEDIAEILSQKFKVKKSKK